MVTHDPGPWFEETLRSVADQTYPDLAVLVVDTASTDDPTDRVRAVLPDAVVHRLDHDPGFGAAANQVRDLVEGAKFLVLCHDDVALDAGAVRTLVEEAFRSNAGVIGPKLVRWDDPRRLLQVGVGADKTGVLVPLNERNELDQEQFDAVRDVFLIPGACTLIRADLFDALDGYDDGIVGLGDDLDLCWRAHALGARVMIAPAARVRHLEALGERRAIDDRRRQLARHRLRTTLVAYGPWHRLRVLPQAFLFALVETVFALLTGRRAQAAEVMAAWPWNLRRQGDIRARRRKLQASRRVGDKEVRELQVSGSARVTGYLRGLIGQRDEAADTAFVRSSRDVVGAFRAGARQFTGMFAIALVLLLVLSSRDLVLGGIPAVGEMAQFPRGPGAFFSSWWSGWRPAGLGSPGAQPTGLFLLGVASTLFLGATSVLRTVLLLAPVPLGALGAWRLARPIGSTRASVAAFAVYLAIPVPYNALARGSVSGLVAYAVSPWILLGLGRASGLAPFGPRQLVDADDETRGTVRPRRMGSLILSLGLLLGVAAAFAPVIVVVAVVVALAMALGSLLCFRVAGVLRLLAVTAGAAALAVALHLPWSFDLLTSRSPWDSVAGVSSTTGGPLGIGRILRFESGPWGAPPLGWAFLLAGVLPVIIGRSWRLEWAVRSWFVALAGWAALWASQDGHLPVGLPSAEVMLAPVAAALALTAALGLAAFETDLRAYRFGWRQVLSVAAALGVVAGAAPLASGLIDGRWRMPDRDYGAALAPLLAGSADGQYRVLWLGDHEVLPAAGWRLDGAVSYTATDHGAPTVLDRFPGPESGATPLLARAVTIAQEQRTTRLGHLLAPMGVRYVIVPARLAPSTASITGLRPPPKELLATLAQQLDLEEVPVGDGITVYRNAAWIPARSVLVPRDGDRTRADQAVADDLTGSKPALRSSSGPTSASGAVPGTGDLLVANTADDGWKLRIDGVPMGRGTTYGWANQFEATRAGPGELTYQTPLLRHLLAVGQVALWVVVVVLWRRSRRGSRSAPDPEVTP